MAVYKVAQDVEADDKLLGPFSFRQFIYLIIVAIAMGLAWGLTRMGIVGYVFIPIPLVVILFFGAIALPLKKDQPMETYLAAIISFHLKPKRRMWEPDGIESMVEITAPKVVEIQRVKDLSESEAEKRLSYLAEIADTEGWAIRHAGMPQTNTSMQADVFYTAQQTEDPLDDSSAVGHSFDTMITSADQRRHDDLIARMHNTVAAPYADPYAALGNQQTVAPQAPMQAPTMPAAPVEMPTIQPQPMAATAPAPIVPPQPQIEEPIITPVFNPYPTMHQQTIRPMSEQQAAPPPVATPPPTPTPPVTTSEKPVSPDIINLANNTDLSIATLAHEAERIRKKHEEDEGEVLISLH